MTGPSLLTIAIPTLRRLAYLREATRSAQEQNHSNFEVLISNDGQDPEIESFGLSMERKDPRVRYTRTPGRLGLSGNWNWCVSQSRGSHVVIIGDDDRLLPGFLSTLAPFTKTFDVVFSDHTLIDSEGKRVEDSPSLLRRYGRDALSQGPVDNPEAMVWKNAVAPSAALVRTEVARKLLFEPNLNTPELDFFVRAAALPARFYFVPQVLAEYRVHGGSATAAGLTLDGLFLKLLQIPARTPEGAVARMRQLARLAPSATSCAIKAGNEVGLIEIKRSKLLRRSTRGVLFDVLLALPRPWLRALLQLTARTRTM
jgi:glycosyltransferase involved in cell wall biosynthesis